MSDLPKPAASPPSDIDAQLKQLELDKRMEEIRQLRASAKTRWITPAALAALLPLLAAFGVWIAGEIKQYNEGYKALAERDALRREKEDLQKQKDSLNQELETLLSLKTHYAAEAERLRRDTESKQATIDKTYLRGVFTHAEALYALDHIKGIGPPPTDEVLKKAREEIKTLSPETQDALKQILERYDFSLVVINSSRDVVAEFDEALALLPASEWTNELQAMPSSSILPDRKIMFVGQGNERRLYDVAEGRFLTAEESKGARW
jgi:hypothetical protein